MNYIIKPIYNKLLNNQYSNLIHKDNKLYNNPANDNNFYNTL